MSIDHLRVSFGLRDPRTQLLCADDVEGWRGNTAAWVARAALTLVEEEPTVDTICTLAPAVQSWRLLLPAMALAVPLDGRCTSVLWHDARYVLLLRDSVRSFPPSPLHPVEVWIGCLVLALQTCFGSTGD